MNSLRQRENDSSSLAIQTLSIPLPDGVMAELRWTGGPLSPRAFAVLKKYIDLVEETILEPKAAATETREPVELTREELLVMFDRITRRELGMTAAEFLERLDRDDLPDSPIVQEPILMAGMPA